VTVTLHLGLRALHFYPDNRMSGSGRGWKQLMYGRNIVAPLGNQAETEKTNLNL